MIIEQPYGLLCSFFKIPVIIDTFPLWLVPKSFIIVYIHDYSSVLNGRWIGGRGEKMTPYYSPAPLGNNTHAALCGQNKNEIVFKFLQTCHITFFNVSISKRTNNQKSLVEKAVALKFTFVKLILVTAGAKLLSINESILTFALLHWYCIRHILMVKNFSGNLKKYFLFIFGSGSFLSKKDLIFKFEMSNHKIANNFIEQKRHLICFNSTSFLMPTDSYCYSLKNSFEE